MKKFLKKIFKGCKAGMKSFLGGGQRAVTLLTLMFVIGIGNVFAAADPFASATADIKGYQTSVQNLLYAIAAVIALVGAFNVYHKMTNGDQDVKKTIMMTLGGCIAMVALSTALPAFFE